MTYKTIILVAATLLISAVALAQTKTTEELHTKHKDAFTLFFYNNTLRMFNQTEDKTFDELIKDIEKMKILMIPKSPNFNAADYKKLVSGYKSESFDEMMSSRHKGKNFDLYMKEKNGVTKGVVVLVNDSTNLYVLDIVGRIALDKVTTLYNALDKNTEFTQKIKAFTDQETNQQDK